MEVEFGPGHILLDGDPAPRPPNGLSPPMAAHVCCGQTAGWIKMPLGMELGLSPGETVLDGGPSSHPKKGHSPHFLAHVRSGQMTGWLKMPLGMEPGLCPGHIVLDGGPAPPKKGAQTPIFGLCLLWPNGHSSQLLLSICFTGQMPLLMPNQQCQSTEGISFPFTMSLKLLLGAHYKECYYCLHLQHYCELYFQKMLGNAIFHTVKCSFISFHC